MMPPLLRPLATALYHEQRRRHQLPPLREPFPFLWHRTMDEMEQRAAAPEVQREDDRAVWGREQ